MGTEGDWGQTQGSYRLGGKLAYAAVERSETGKLNNSYSSLGSGVSRSDWYENSDLRPKDPTSTGLYVET